MYLYLWSFLLVPAINIIRVFPSWRIVIFNSVVIISIELIVEIFQQGYIQQRPVINWIYPLVFSALTNVSIFLALACVKINIYKNMKCLEEQAISDSLMGIYNRRYFDSYIEKILPVIRETNEGLLLLSIDIDHFKNINDSYGHVCGDEVLLRMSDIIKANVRKYDKIFRMGGEEVVILLPNTTIRDGKIVAERLREAIRITQFSYRGESFFVTVSIGIAQYDGETVKEFMEKADDALYRAKRNGRNQVVVHNTHHEDISVCN